MDRKKTLKNLRGSKRKFMKIWCKCFQDELRAAVLEACERYDLTAKQRKFMYGVGKTTLMDKGISKIFGYYPLVTDDPKFRMPAPQLYHTTRALHVEGDYSEATKNRWFTTHRVMRYPKDVQGIRKSNADFYVMRKTTKGKKIVLGVKRRGNALSFSPVRSDNSPIEQVMESIIIDDIINSSFDKALEIFSKDGDFMRVDAESFLRL